MKHKYSFRACDSVVDYTGKRPPEIIGWRSQAVKVQTTCSTGCLIVDCLQRTERQATLMVPLERPRAHLSIVLYHHSTSLTLLGTKPWSQGIKLSLPSYTPCHFVAQGVTSTPAPRHLSYMSQFLLPLTSLRSRRRKADAAEKKCTLAASGGNTALLPPATLLVSVGPF